jgi:hypothetical protein
MKSEVRALEYAASGLVYVLDRLLIAELGLRLLNVNQGLRIFTPDHLKDHPDAFVAIRPFGWPEPARITARFISDMGGWRFYEGGEIFADHLHIPANCLRFKPSDDGLGVQFLSPHGRQRQYIQQGYEQVIHALQRDLVNLSR